MMLLASQRLLALTRGQFDNWEKSRQNKYLKQHPNSSFHDKNSTKPDSHRARLKRHKEGHFSFTDNEGKSHSYKSAQDVENHLDKMHAQMDKLAQQYHKGSPGGRIRRDAEARMQNLADHAKALQDLARNKTASKELGFGKNNDAQHGLDTVKQYLNYNKPKGKPALKAPAKAPVKAPAKKAPAKIPKRKGPVDKHSEEPEDGSEPDDGLKPGGTQDKMAKKAKAPAKAPAKKTPVKQAREADEDEDVARDANKSPPKKAAPKPAEKPAKPVKLDFSKHGDEIVRKADRHRGFGGMSQALDVNLDDEDTDFDAWKNKVRSLHPKAQFRDTSFKDSRGNTIKNTVAEHEGREHGSFDHGISKGHTRVPVTIHKDGSGKYTHTTHKGETVHGKKPEFKPRPAEPKGNSDEFDF